VLVEIDGVRILTDPMLSKRASPFEFSGPARLHPVPLAPDQWRNIDAVVTSHDHFKAIRERLGAPDMALIKVGAYGDTWMDIHMNPESAVQDNQDLGADVMLPVHWATFNLACHDWAEPVERTLAAAKDNDLHLVTPRVGEKFEFGIPFESKLWFLPQGN